MINDSLKGFNVVRVNGVRRRGMWHVTITQIVSGLRNNSTHRAVTGYGTSIEQATKNAATQLIAVN